MNPAFQEIPPTRSPGSPSSCVSFSRLCTNDRYWAEEYLRALANLRNVTLFYEGMCAPWQIVEREGLLQHYRERLVAVWSWMGSEAQRALRQHCPESRVVVCLDGTVYLDGTIYLEAP